MPPLSKVRCCRPKKFGRLPEGLPHRPSLRTNPSKTALSLENRQHPCLMNALPVSHPHYPSPRTKLASPRKRVRFCCSVKPSQLWWGLNLIELLSLKLQSIRSATIRPAPTFPKPHYPSPRTIALASLVKGRWLDGTTQTVALLRPACDMSALFILQTFCRQDGGIAIPPFAQHHIYASLVKGEVLSPKRIRATTGGIAFLPHPFRFSDTSVNNPSVTVTENTILCQRIFNFYKKQY